MAKNNKPAEAYAKPHTMQGTDVGPKEAEAAVVKKGNQMDDLDISVAGVFKKQKGENKNGSWEFRGAGAATKGRKSYGPLA
jgi:hypothetical protein